MVGSAVPQLKGDDLLSILPRGGVDVHITEVSNLPGSHLTPVQALDMMRQVEATLQATDVDGVVVTHGTDTIEESAYLVDLTLNSNKPVVFTGALRAVTTPGYDGIVNLAAAVQVAASSETRNLGALLVFDDQIFAASEAQQTHSQSTGAFAAPGSGPLGWIEGDRVIIRHRPAQRLFIPCTRIEERVDLLTITQGAEDRLLRHAVETGVAGVVLEVFGSGRVPPWWLPTIREAMQQRTSVVITSRSGAGTLYDEFGYVGAFHDLRRLGVLFAHNLNGIKARIKLMVALGAARRPEELRGWFA